MAMSNYYVILGLGNDAGEDEIRSAYRRLAKKYHPDHYGGDGSEFQRIQEAYGVLSDPEKKRRYDESRRPGESRPFANVGGNAGRPRHVEPLDPRPADPMESFVRRWFGMEDSLFDDPFGGARAETRWGGRSTHAGTPDINIKLSVRQAARGGTVRTWITVRAPCRSCGGRRAIGPWLCDRCGGMGLLEGEVPVEVRFPAGIADGHTSVESLAVPGVGKVHVTVRFRVAGG